jgi:hypothetical protein
VWIWFVLIAKGNLNSAGRSNFPLTLILSPEGRGKLSLLPLGEKDRMRGEMKEKCKKEKGLKEKRKRYE